MLSLQDHFILFVGLLSTFLSCFSFFLFHSYSLSFYQLLKLDLCTPLKIALVSFAEQHCLGSSIRVIQEGECLNVRWFHPQAFAQVKLW